MARKRKKTKSTNGSGLGYVSFRQPLSLGDTLLEYTRLYKEYKEQKVEERYELSRKIYFEAW